jgi:hypothetical protein
VVVDYVICDSNYENSVANACLAYDNAVIHCNELDPC